MAAEITANRSSDPDLIDCPEQITSSMFGKTCHNLGKGHIPVRIKARQWWSFARSAFSRRKQRQRFVAD
jgi:hypothetical protein